MALVALVVGIVIVVIGLVLLRSGQSSGPVKEPSFPISGYLLYGLGAGLCVAGAYFLILVPSASYALPAIYIGIAIALFITAKKVFSVASTAGKRHAENMAAYAAAKASHAQYERNQIELENARRHAAEQAELDALKREVERKRLVVDYSLIDEEERTRITEHQTRQRELGLRRQLADAAERYGLDVDGVIDVNKHQYKSEIDLQERAAKVNQDLAAADRLDSSQQREIISKLRTEMEKLLRERSRVEKKEKDEFVKQRLLARYDKDIENLEAEIDARGARLVLSENGKETRRLT